MGLSETLIFYLLIGAGVSTAVLLSSDGQGSGERAFRTVTAIFFWPMYLPLLLRRRDEQPGRLGANEAPPPADEMAAAIARVEAELDAALASLDGWAEDVLSREQDRFAELRTVWHSQAARVRELDRLLDQADGEPSAVGSKDPSVACQVGNWEAEHGDGPPQGDFQLGNRMRESERARQENLRRLRHIRDQLYKDLMGALAWVRELVTLIHLAKFTGAPASRAEELVGQIAAAVEGLSEVTSWPQHPTTSSPQRPPPHKPISVEDPAPKSAAAHAGPQSGSSSLSGCSPSL